MHESELSTDRLVKEAQVLLGAGTASTARTLDFICYYILADREIHSRLQEEIKDSMAEYPQRAPSWAELEKLPYLQAIIKEGLRLSYGVMHRLPRCFPDNAIQYKEWTIPRNVSYDLFSMVSPLHSYLRLTKSPGPCRNVSLHDAHGVSRIPLPLQIQTRTLARRDQPRDEEEPRPILQRVSELSRHEVSEKKQIHLSPLNP